MTNRNDARSNAFANAGMLGLAAAIMLTAGAASAASINDENRLRELSAPIFGTPTSGVVFEGRASQEPVGFSINDENLQRAHSAPVHGSPASGRVLDGRASSSPDAAFINDENRNRFLTFGR